MPSLVQVVFELNMPGMCPVRTPLPPPPHPVEIVIVALPVQVTSTESIGCIYYQVSNR